MSTKGRGAGRGGPAPRRGPGQRARAGRVGPTPRRRPARPQRLAAQHLARRAEAPLPLQLVELVPTALARQPAASGVRLCVGAVIVEVDADFDAATSRRVLTVVGPCLPSAPARGCSWPRPPSTYAAPSMPAWATSGACMPSRSMLIAVTSSTETGGCSQHFNGITRARTSTVCTCKSARTQPGPGISSSQLGLPISGIGRYGGLTGCRRTRAAKVRRIGPPPRQPNVQRAAAHRSPPTRATRTYVGPRRAGPAPSGPTACPAKH